MENVHFDVRIRHSTANTLSDFKACDRQFVPAIGTGTLPFGCPGCSAVSGAGWLTFGGFDEGHLYRLERQPRGLFLRSCAKFRWDICRIIRRKWVRIDAFERQHNKRYGRITGSKYCECSRQRHNRQQSRSPTDEWRWLRAGVARQCRRHTRSKGSHAEPRKYRCRRPQEVVRAR